MNLFLTGAIQVGKSTMIDRILEKHSEWRVGGFRSVTVYGDLPEAIGGVYLQPGAGAFLPTNEKNRIGVRRNAEHCFNSERYPAVFDTFGVSLLEGAQTCDLVRMDELGVMERDADFFSARVLELVRSAVPVLGVIKPAHTPLLDAVRQDSGTLVLEVTPENRESLLPRAEAFTVGAVELYRRPFAAKSCGAAVLRRENGVTETLLIRYWNGHWSFPKGHQLGAETEEQTALREIREETNAEVALLPGYRFTLESAQNERNREIVCFAARYCGGRLRPLLTELQELQWVPLERAPELVRYEQDKEVFRRLLANDPLEKEDGR